MSILNYNALRINQQEENLTVYQGKVILVVNTASKCGFTRQYTGLQKLYETYHTQGFTILGFPCNQFGSQEKGTNKEIEYFCNLNFSITFPMFSKIRVNGKEAHPFFTELKKAAPGILGTKRIKWNFTKFLISRDTKRITRFSPKDTPGSLIDAIEKELAEKPDKTIENQA